MVRGGVADGGRVRGVPVSRLLRLDARAVAWVVGRSGAGGRVLRAAARVPGAERSRANRRRGRGDGAGGRPHALGRPAMALHALMDVGSGLVTGIALRESPPHEDDAAVAEASPAPLAPV